VNKEVPLRLIISHITAPILPAVQVSGCIFSPTMGISPHHVKNSQLVNTMGTLQVGLKDRQSAVVWRHYSLECWIQRA